MASDENRTIQKTQWTDSLLQDLCTALKSGREDKTVRGFARELMDDKGLPIGYLVRKVEEQVGPEQAERLDVIVRGRIAVDASKSEKAKSEGGVRGLMRKLLG